MPLAAGDQFVNKWEFRTLIDEALIVFVRPDLGIVGGVTEARKIARWARRTSFAPPRTIRSGR